MKAMLLAAGRGSRLRPLTDTTHKVLLPVMDGCLLEFALLKLRHAGIEEIAINVSYLAKQVMQYLGDGSHYGVRLYYSLEEPECLGTGGGVRRVLPWLGEEPFWLLSADIWSEYPLTLRALPESTDAHLVMVNNPSFHPEGDYGVDAQGELCMAEPTYTFSGISLLRPQLFQKVRSPIFQLSDVFAEVIAGRRATGELYQGPWFNVGTEAELNQLRQHFGKIRTT